ncbi:MAG: helix-turn-helix domain-containing protein [Bacilli bacterium]|nr:helix-turn-helix domain-containing protein [Bacilli bacterium]
MNNQFSENLKKIRKEQNLSQEELADKLGVSRQAISKWESGQAYPEMDKIITICNMFNVNIDDLLHNDIKEVKGEEESKKKINSFVDGFLKYITNTINMFSSMTFKSKVKCIFEQILIAFILFILSIIIVNVLGSLFTNIFSFIPVKVVSILYRIITSIFTIFCIILSLVIMTHIFKTRYLDYYESMDKETPEEESSEETTEEGKSVKLDKKDRKIVIRDPKHSEYRFIKGLLKVIVGIIKFFALCFGFYLALILIGIFCAFILSFLVVKTGLFFVGVVVAILAASVIVGDILLLILNFVFNRKSNKKMMIWSFLIGLALFGIGFGLSFVGGLKFDVELDNSSMFKIVTVEHDMNNELNYVALENCDVEYVESDINNIKIDYTVNKYCEVEEYDINTGLHAHADCHEPMKVAREVIKNLNNKKVIGFDQTIDKVTVYASKQNIDILKYNIDKYYAEQKEYQNQIEEYESEINRLEEENNDLRNKINDLQIQEKED